MRRAGKVQLGERYGHDDTRRRRRRRRRRPKEKEKKTRFVAKVQMSH